MVLLVVVIIEKELKSSISQSIGDPGGNATENVMLLPGGFVNKQDSLIFIKGICWALLFTANIFAIIKHIIRVYFLFKVKVQYLDTNLVECIILTIKYLINLH